MSVNNYSILLPVYHKDKKEYLILSIESMLNQTVKSDDFVIVKDGPLTAELDEVLNEYASNKGNNINIVGLETNSGLGAALDYGLGFCKNELVARMDADDISLPTRCERLLELFDKNPKLSIAGTNMDEFDEDPHVLVSSRVVPSTDEEIKKFIRRRNAFNHPTVMFKKSEVQRAGSYSSNGNIEDMDLFSRMMSVGCVAENIPESLLLSRKTVGAAVRRPAGRSLSGDESAETGPRPRQRDQRNGRRDAHRSDGALCQEQLRGERHRQDRGTSRPRSRIRRGAFQEVLRGVREKSNRGAVT